MQSYFVCGKAQMPLQYTPKQLNSFISFCSMLYVFFFRNGRYGKRYELELHLCYLESYPKICFGAQSTPHHRIALNRLFLSSIYVCRSFPNGMSLLLYKTETNEVEIHALEMGLYRIAHF